MVSKNTTVRSIRLSNETWEWLSGEAEKRGTTVNGLVAEGVALMRAPQPRTRGMWGRMSEDQREKALACPGDEGLGSPAAEAPHVSVPLHKPKPFNPQPKRGKK